MCGDTQYKIGISAIWVQALLYGLYMVLFSASIYILIWHRPNKRNLIVSVALFVFTTVDVFLDYSLTILSPNIISKSTIESGVYLPCPDADLAARSQESSTYDVLNLISDGTYTINFILADGLLISRCVTLWSTTRWIIIPLGFLLAGTTACNIASLYYDIHVYVLDRNPNTSRSAKVHNGALDTRFLEIGDILSLATTVIATSLIVFKIWKMMHEIERVMGRKAGVRYRAAMAMLIESGVLFAASLVTSLASVYADVNFSIGEVFVAMFMGMAPTLIIVRVGLGRGFESVHDNNATRESSAGYSSKPGTRGQMSRIHFQTMASSASSECQREDKTRGNVVESKPTTEATLEVAQV